MELTPVKVRDDKWPPSRKFRVKDVLGLSVDGRSMDSAVIQPVDTGSGSPGVPAASTLKGRVFQHVHDNPDCTARGLREVRGGSRQINEAAQELCDLGAIVDEGAGTAKAYRVVPGWSVDRDGTIKHVGADFQPADLSDLEPCALVNDDLEGDGPHLVDGT